MKTFTKNLWSFLAFLTTGFACVVVLFTVAFFGYNYVHFKMVFKTWPWESRSVIVVLNTKNLVCSDADYWKDKSEWLMKGEYKDTEIAKEVAEIYSVSRERCREVGDLGTDFGYFIKIRAGDYRVPLEFSRH